MNAAATEYVPAHIRMREIAHPSLRAAADHMVLNTIIPMIDNGTARHVPQYDFENEAEWKVRHFVLWGEVIRQTYFDTCAVYHFVVGEPKARILGGY